MLKFSTLFCSLAFALGLSAPLCAQDTTPPAAAVVTPPDGSYVNSLPLLAGTASDETAVSDVQLAIIRQPDGYYWDGAAFISSESWVAASFSAPSWEYASLPAWADGSSYAVTAKAMDSSGNWSAVSAASVFTYDTSVPAISISAPADSSRVKSLPLISGTAADAFGVSAAQVRIYDKALDKYWLGGTGSCGGTPLPGWVGPACPGFPEIWNVAAGSSTTGAEFAWSYDAGSLPWPDRDGGLIVEGRAADQAGNAAVVSSTFSFDATPPQSAVIYPADGVSYSSIAAITGTSSDLTSPVSDVRLKMWYLSGGSTYYWQPAPPHWSVSDSGWWAISGAAGPKSVFNPWSYTNADFSPGSANFAWQEGTHDGLPGKIFYLATQALDAAANSEVTYATRTFAYVEADAQAPSVAVLQPADNVSLNALPQLSGTAADNVAVASVAVSVQRNDTGLYWDGGSWVPGLAEVSASLWPSSWTCASVPAWVDGSSYTVVGKAVDTSANWAVVYSTALFTYDVTAPSLAITTPVTGTYAAFTALSGTAADAHGVAQVEVSVRRQSDLQYWTGTGWAAGPLWNAATGTTAWTYTGITSAELESGATWLFNVRARDAAGNISDPGPVSSTFTYVLPPEGALSPGAFSGLWASSLTVNWGTDFSAGTTYYVRLAAQAAPSPYLYSGSSSAAALLFTGLTPDSFYYGFVSTSPASGFIASGSGRTLAEALALAAFTGVGYSSASLSWAAGGNPAWTIYEYEISESASFDALTGFSSGPVTGGLFTGLAQGTTYYGRVRAVNGGGAATEYAYAPLAVTQALLPSGLAAGLSGSALGTDSIAWAWNSGTLSDADHYALYSGPGLLLATAPFAASASFTQTGLGPNTALVLRVAGGNGNGEGPLAVSATVYTLAQTPSDPAAAQVELTSAALTLGLNGNPAGTALQLWRSADNVSFTSLYEGAAPSYADDSLSECSAYYYKARARNGAGFYSGFSGVLSFTTLASTPAAPGGLYAEAQDGARIMLAWEPSPSASVTGYSLYYDSASGAVDYASPLAVFSSAVTSWTTPALAAGATYKFALRADGACGTQEKNTSMLASAQAVGVLSGVRAAIKVPQTGKRIKGNMVTVVAETILGLPSQAARVRFQYSPAGAGAWTDIPAASYSNPNPDLSAPYFVHWDADAMAAGAYDLRAVATDVYGAADPAAPSVTVVIDPVNYDISETVTGGEQSKEQKINNAVTSTVQAADDATTLVTKIVIPSGAVTDSTAAVTLVNNPSFIPAPPPGADPLSLAVKINLSNGQSRLSGGQSAALSFTYKDDDDNGIVDGTLAAVDRLRVYSVSDSGGAWAQLATSVDKERKTVSAATTHFSFFSVFAAAASGLGAVKIYPVPWQPGTGGRFDSAQGVTFSGLPAAARIKIFTPAGELVRLLEVAAADAGFKVWDGRNSEGHKAASGIYLAVVKSGSDERTLKVAVER